MQTGDYIESCSSSYDFGFVRLGRKYGISAVALGKVCRKLKVPLPGRGYWAKKEFGKVVKQVPLPEFKNAPVVRRLKTMTLPHPLSDSQDPELARIAAVKSRPIPLSTDQHRLVASSVGLLKRARTNQFGIVEPPTDKPCPDVRVSKELLDRALVLVNTILVALEENGFDVKIGPASMSVQIFGQDVSFGIAEELRVKERREEKRYYGTQKVIVYERSGNLVFHISTWADKCRKRWADSKTQRVENMLPACLAGLALVARTVRNWSDEIKRRQLEREQRERERAELARQIQEQEHRLRELEMWSINWNKAKQIREFVTAFREACSAKGVPTTPGSPKGAWIEWALQQADRLDPLVESPPSVLDRKIAQPHW